MERLAGEIGGEEKNPGVVSYTVALGAWIGAANVDLEDVLQAQELLQRSIRNHKELGWKCKPDSYSFSYLIAICKNFTGTESERERVLDIALGALEESLSGDTSKAPYGLCIHAVDQLCSDEAKRGEIMNRIFDKCCQTGDVTKGVVGAMKTCAWKENVPEMQVAWSRRVSPRDKPVGVKWADKSNQ